MTLFYYGYCKGEHVDRVGIQSYLLLFYWVYCGVGYTVLLIVIEMIVIYFDL